MNSACRWNSLYLRLHFLDKFGHSLIKIIFVLLEGRTLILRHMQAPRRSSASLWDATPDLALTYWSSRSILPEALSRAWAELSCILNENVYLHDEHDSRTHYPSQNDTHIRVSGIEKPLVRYFRARSGFCVLLTPELDFGPVTPSKTISDGMALMCEFSISRNLKNCIFLENQISMFFCPRKWWRVIWLPWR